MIPLGAVAQPTGIGDMNMPGLANGGAGISPIGNPMVNRPPGADVSPAPSGAPMMPPQGGPGSPMRPPNLGGPLRVGPGGPGASPVRAFGDRGSMSR